MAAPFPARPRPLTQVELIGKLYLNLWKRLDLIDGENRWADVAPIDPAALDAYIASIHEEMSHSVVNAALHEEAEALYGQAKATIDHGQVVPHFQALKDRLRDEAERFMSEAARTR